MTHHPALAYPREDYSVGATWVATHNCTLQFSAADYNRFSFDDYLTSLDPVDRVEQGDVLLVGGYARTGMHVLLVVQHVRTGLQALCQTEALEMSARPTSAMRIPRLLADLHKPATDPASLQLKKTDAA